MISDSKIHVPNSTGQWLKLKVGEMGILKHKPGSLPELLIQHLFELDNPIWVPTPVYLSPSHPGLSPGNI